MERDDALSALNSIGDARAQLADALECPPWRHALFGAIMGLFVLAMAFETPLSMLLVGIATLAVALTAVNDRKRMGVFVNGYRWGGTLPVSLGLAACTALLMVAQIRLREDDSSLVLGVGLAGAEFVVATLASVLWQRLFRAEMLKRRA